MASTNQTDRFSLSQFLGSDTPDWLQDYNRDMQQIDTHAAWRAVDAAEGNLAVFDGSGNPVDSGKTPAAFADGGADGAALSAQKLSQARTINGVAFDGTENITVKAEASGGTAERCTGSAAAAAKLETARTINGVLFDGTANITVKAEADGGAAASCTGNAATATKLETARLINGTAFDGTANITVTAAASGGDADTVGGKSAAQLLDYQNLTNKPAAFVPAAHTHDDRYYTEGELDTLLAAKAPATHTHTAAEIASGILPAARGGTGVTGTGSVAPVNADLVDGKHAADLLNYHNHTNRPAMYQGGGTNAVLLNSAADNTAMGDHALAEGQDNIASGAWSHAEGNGTKAENMCAHAEGSDTKASGYYSHAEGNGSVASGECAHAEGAYTQAVGSSSHAQGTGAAANGECASAHGYYTTADLLQFVIGRNNNPAKTGPVAPMGRFSMDGSIFVIGNGIQSEKTNAFRVATDGHVYGCYGYASSGADYAERFEWLDKNPGREDRRGRFVTLCGEKIRIAGPRDSYILGAVSDEFSACVIGEDGSERWNGMFLTDVFSRPLTDKTPEGGVTWRLNPQYDTKKEYIPRADRPEWGLVGLIGTLVVVDDGTCTADGYCTVADGGCATACEAHLAAVSGGMGGPVGYPRVWRVLKRLDETHIRILIK